MKTYKSSRLMLTLIFTTLGFMVVIGLFTLISQTAKAYPDLPQMWWFLILWLCALGWIWYYYLKISFEIRVQADASIEFRSFLQRVVVSPDEIKSIKALGVITKIQHKRGTAKLLTPMDGLHDFISTVKSLNPAVEVKGC